MKVYHKAVLPKKFKANGIFCGIKKSKKLDLALFHSEIPARASCLFTTNKIQAAPVRVSKQHLKNSKIFNAIIANSGNANCFTGGSGIKDAKLTVKALAQELGVEEKNILVASTGIIGKRLPVNLIIKALPQLAKGASKEGIDKAKKAIMTTDIFTKEVTVKFNCGSKDITICGVAKGVGMIAPSMATMLAFVLTDANVTQNAINRALKACVDNSFNCITIDGCMSTNDSVMLLANGASGNTLIDKGANFNLFVKALNIICLTLAKMLVRDGEGASKFIEIKVRGAKSFKDAKQAALNIANSNLFKTACFGENPNFGRIVASIGASGVDVKEEDIRIKVSSLKKKDIFVDALIGSGDFSCVVYTSDLTPEYIKINAEYN